MPALGDEQSEETGPKPSLIQSQIDMGAVDDSDEDAPQLTQADLIRNKIGMCSECKSVISDSQVENNVFYQSGQPMPCPFCNIPDAPIWMGDFSFKPIGDISIGDEVIGIKIGKGRTLNERLANPYDKHKSVNVKSKLIKTHVLDITWHKAPVVRVEMESGRHIICTDNHYWYNYDTKITDIRNPLKPVTVPKIGKRLSFVVNPHFAYLNTEQAYWAGYLGGMYDGEGSHLRISQSRIVNPHICANIETALNKLDIQWTITHDKSGPEMNDYTLLGGRQGYMDFLQKCQPVKRQLESYILNTTFRDPDTIVNIESAFSGREVDVVDITTETGNYIAWGYASKNCGGVVAIVPEALASTKYFQNRLDQMRGIGMTGYIPGVTAE